jgi:NAD(P)-dependent dehydrogenase (short-subunit alcohol dehydrogenase family)
MGEMMMKRIVMTGVTSGFGQQWLYQLDKQQDIEFFVLARNKSKFEAMLKLKPLSNQIHFIECDLLSISSIHAAADQIQQLTDGIDVLVNNAGWWGSNTFDTSSDDIESTFAVNQVAPFLLTGRLLPMLSKSKQGRIINTASFRYEDAKIDRNDLQLKKNFNAEQAYCNSKFYSVLFTQSLAEKLVGTGITVNCFDPGIVDTPMLKKALPVWLSPFYSFVRRFVARTPDKGAETGVYLCESDSVSTSTGSYYKDKSIQKTKGSTRDTSLANLLWKNSTDLSGFEYS